MLKCSQQVLRHLFNVAPVHDFIGRFPIRVCTSYQVGMGNHADAADISVLETADWGLPCLYEHFLIIIQFPFLSAVLLQDDQVTAHLRTRVVRERLFGRRATPTGLACFIIYLRMGALDGASSTPCEVMNATMPPSRTVSRLFRKK